ncbi:MAG TPA: endonuclease domain-containing protein [Flavisolibacter sp.]|nr:endonuclease domain-containing protein [Flavisolibacter sp.]
MKHNGNQPYAKKSAERMFAGADNVIFKRAASLRQRQTHAEEVLWGFLRTKPLGYKFTRQHPYLHYILDFYCHQQKLAIEVDGLIHQKDDVSENDAIRQKHLEDHGLTVLHFANHEIEQALEDVISKIERHLTAVKKASERGGRQT